MSAADNGIVYEFDGWRLVPAQRQLLSAQDGVVALRSKVFDLLLYLVEQRGRVVEKSELMLAVWPNAVVEENNLNQAISALRQALGESAQEQRLVATVTGRGYQFVGDVRVVAPAKTKAKSTSITKFALAAIAVVVAAGIWFMQQESSKPVETGLPVIERFSELTPILATDLQGSQTEPTLSPDGSMIAWIGETSGTPQVWIKNLQSGGPIQITNDAFAASSPSWSPDGSYIVYARKGPTGRAIYRVGPLGTPPSHQIVRAGLDPSFALRANVFVFTDGRRLFVASGEGEDVREVTAVPEGPGFAQRAPALSPDASQVAFIHADSGPLGNLWIAPVDGGEARALTSFTLEDGSAVGSLSWMPDGRTIVYSVNNRGGGSRLWQVDAETGAAEPLTTGSGNPIDPVVSSNGQRLAYTDTRASWRITRVDPETGERNTLIESRYQVALPQASSDGNDIVYFSLLPTGAQILSVDFDGRETRQWTFNEPGTNTLPFWSSDGGSVFYYRDNTLRRIYRDEDRDELVLPDFHWSSKNWAANFGDQLLYHEFDSANDFRRTVIEDLVSGDQVELSVPVVGGEWSRDGSEIVAFVLRGGASLYVCDAETLQCRPVTNAGENVEGMRPHWSRDGSRIYYIWWSDKSECCDLWVVDRDGSAKEKLANLPGFDLRGSYFGVDSNGDIFYNHADESTAEIWFLAAD